MRRIATRIGSTSLSIHLWRAEKGWRSRENLNSTSLPRRIKGFFMIVWGVTSGYSTRPLRLLTTDAMVWMVSTALLYVTSNSVANLTTLQVTSPDTEVLRFCKLAYASLSAIITVGNVDITNAASPLYFVILAFSSIVGLVSIACLLSIVGVFQFIVDK